MNRRKFVASLGVLGALAGLTPLRGATHSSRDKRAGPLMKCRPYLQASRRDGITVRWITTRRSYSWVEYGDSPAMLNQKAVQVEDGLARADKTVHAVTLNRLQPGKTYHYRVVSREVLSLARKEVSFGPTESSETHRFTTPAEDAGQAEFLVLNDIHDRPESFAALMKHQEPGRKDCVFLNGDMFNFLESEDQIINHLLDPLAAFATHTPFYFVRGNHETWGDFSRQLRDYFDGGAEKFFYSLPLGPVYALVMDSGESKPDDHVVHGGIHAFDDYRETQARWLEEEVCKPAFKQAAFRVVLVHIPPFYLGEPVHASVHCRERWVPILNRAGIDLMICGHTHKRGVHPAVPGQHHFPIVIGGGPRDGHRTIIAVKASRRALSLTMRDDAGKQVGQLQIDAS